MKYVTSDTEMARIDEYTINEIGIPQMVLMERAALGCIDIIIQEYKRLHLNKICLLPDLSCLR